MSQLKYLSGFGNEFSSEAKAGALPQNQNSPQKCPYGLYAEQLSGSAFTAPRKENFRTWLYKMRPSVRIHGRFRLLPHPSLVSKRVSDAVTPEQLRWDPLQVRKRPTDFIDGLVTMATNGDFATQTGSAVHLYAANRSMKDQYFYNADGEMLIVPQEGALELRTEAGILHVSPKEIGVIPRGMKFQVHLLEEKARGYVCENFGQAFRLPDLGPIGANGLASPRHFLSPTAWYEDRKGKFELIAKFQGNLWTSTIDCSPLDVVAWHGNYLPYKYDLTLFNVINTVSFDHPDPCIFTVLTSPSEKHGTANVDFVIFPPRWMVAENTFRPPYFHRNCMSEFMGLIHGAYDAKKEGFHPGGASLHNCMSPHGPDSKVFEHASSTELKPTYIANTLAFMFESRYVFHPTAFAMKTKNRGGLLQEDYVACWSDLDSHFNSKAPKP